MDSYEIWCDLREGKQDLEFCADVAAYLTHLVGLGAVESFRIRRRKLGLAPDDSREFNITIEFRDMAQLDAAFSNVARREGELERLHAAVYSTAINAKFALYRDFPDPCR